MHFSCSVNVIVLVVDRVILFHIHHHMLWFGLSLDWAPKIVTCLVEFNKYEYREEFPVAKLK